MKNSVRVGSHVSSCPIDPRTQTWTCHLIDFICGANQAWPPWRCPTCNAMPVSARVTTPRTLAHSRRSSTRPEAFTVYRFHLWWEVIYCETAWICHFRYLWWVWLRVEKHNHECGWETKEPEKTESNVFKGSVVGLVRPQSLTTLRGDQWRPLALGFRHIRESHGRNVQRPWSESIEAMTASFNFIANFAIATYHQKQVNMF